MPRDLEQNAQRLQHIGLIIGNQNSSHGLTVNRVSGAVSIVACQIAMPPEPKFDYRRQSLPYYLSRAWISCTHPNFSLTTALMPSNSPRISLLTASCIVIANMIGTGIFTSLGFQVGDLPSGFAIIALWAVGGICAMCGALSYAELAAALPRSGGEYHFLREIYNPSLGFLAGWISATVGFSAPVAIAAMPFGTYLAEIFPTINPLVAAMAALWIVTFVLLCDLRLGSAFQFGSTVLKVLLIAVLIGAGFYLNKTQPISFWPMKGNGALIASTPFAISLYWVMYAYSGWNASTYITGEIRNPPRNLPLCLALAALIVSVIDVCVSRLDLRTASVAEMNS